ncbi:MAG: transporter [Spirochaetota bacterium]
MHRVLARVILTSLFFLKAIFINVEIAAGQEKWDPPSAGPVTTWTAPVCEKGEFVIQPFFFYNRTRGVFNSDGHYDSLTDGDKKYQYQEQLFMQYGLTDRLEVDGQLVYQQNYAKQDGLKVHSSGLGDSYLFLRYCAFEEQEMLPHITGVFQLKIPTGKYQKADADKLGTDLMGATSGGGSYDHGYGINLTKRLKPFIIHADAIYSFPIERKIDAVKTKYAGYLNYDFGFECFLPKGFNLMLEFNGFLQGDKKEDGGKISSSNINYFSIAPGIGWSNEKIQMLLAYQRTLIGTNTDANDSVVLTCVYAF